jgi:nucleotide-binding universal stress UspA family protein
MFAPKSILVPTDFSEHSDKAIRQAADIAEQNDSKIYLLHVVGWAQEWANYTISIPGETIKTIVDDSVKAAKKTMEAEVDKLRKTRKVEVTYDVKVGVPHQQILKEHEERKVDLIVMGSHGRGEVTKILIGSVADRVIHQAKCPVLLVR